MNKKLLPMVTIVVIMCASGCAHSVVKLKQNDELRHQVLKECLAMGLKAKDDPNCQNATKAQAEIAGESIKEMFQ